MEQCKAFDPSKKYCYEHKFSLNIYFKDAPSRGFHDIIFAKPMFAFLSHKFLLTHKIS